MTPVALTIAGSDSGGGAGVQADLKTFAFHRIHGASVLTCLTAQNTVSVTKVAPVETSMVVAQIDAVMQDLRVDAVKTGMLFEQKIIEAVAQKISEYKIAKLVVDPVMVSRSGVQLIDSAAIESLKKSLLPQASIVTPNRYEAELLSGIKIDSLETSSKAAIKIQQELKIPVVLVKGGGLPKDIKATDVWFDGENARWLTEKIIDTKNTHGTGCTLSAAICANLALGKDLWSAVVAAKKYLTTALAYSLDIGAGCGPVGHFFPILNSE